MAAEPTTRPTAEKPSPGARFPRARPRSLSVMSGLLPVNRAQIMTDVPAGVTLAAVSIPVALGYAKIAGMPVVTGLYTLLLPMAAFAVLARPAILSSARIPPRRQSSPRRWPGTRSLGRRTTSGWPGWRPCWPAGCCCWPGWRGSASWPTSCPGPS